MKEAKVFEQDSPYSSPWNTKQKVMMLFWEYVWNILCIWTPKPANSWRLFLLRCFGTKILGRPFVHQRAKIQIPWNLTLHHRACLGDGAVAYSLGEIEIHEHATVAQEAYLCTGTHDFSSSSMNLITKKITIGAHAFIGARAFVMPGVTIGARAIVGACSVATKDVADGHIVVGNPAKYLAERKSDNP